METKIKQLLTAIDMLQPFIGHNANLLEKAYDEALIHTADICLSNDVLLNKVREGQVELLSEDACIEKVLTALSKELNKHVRDTLARCL